MTQTKTTASAVLMPTGSKDYRSHTCGALTANDIGKSAKLSGWIQTKRDHGQLLFIDLRDHYGLVQCVVDVGSSLFKEIEKIRIESVITVEGPVVKRAAGTENSKLATGQIEVRIEKITVQSEADVLPIQITGGDNSEEQRLTYRFLDLRRDKLHQNIMLRSKVIAALRREMNAQGFTEYQTPILTASSPEGARDFLVPSRLHPGKFYALPQAPQQFKQLLMVSGFDRYFQIAPCFRDEDSRADRSPGEFYQLDFEMSFATQDDVFAVCEQTLGTVFNEFANGKAVSSAPFPRITFIDAMFKYGSDKPDLRNPLVYTDVTDMFRGSAFAVFANAIKDDAKVQVKALRVPGAADKPRSFFDKLGDAAVAEGLGGLAYLQMLAEGPKGPMAKALDADKIKKLSDLTGAKTGDAVFFVLGRPDKASKPSGKIRTMIGEQLGLIDKNRFEFCWVVDFPMYELNEETGKVDFNHNPFSMPQGGMDALMNKDPLEILAYQYDIVCNGIELSSGAIRNHRPDIMYKAFEIAGYGPEVVEQKFAGMLNAFKYGAPPHGGCAPGVDRIVMMLADEPNLREIILFPMNQQAEDLMMKAPAPVTEKQLRELRLKVQPANK